MNDFVFKFIFENEKDNPLSNANNFRYRIRKRYGITDKADGTKLYVAITQYQVKKYGSTLDIRKFYCKEDYIKRAIAMRNIRRYKKNR